MATSARSNTPVRSGPIPMFRKSTTLPRRPRSIQFEAPPAMKRTSPSSVDPVYFRPRVRASSAINAIPVVTVNRAFLAMGGKLAPRLRNPPACRSPDCPMRRLGPKFTLQREHGLVGPPLAVFIAQLKTATRARTANVNFAGGETRAQLPARCCSLRHRSTGRREMVRERIDRFSQRGPMAAVCAYGRRSVKAGSCRSDVGRSFLSASIRATVDFEP